MSEPKPKIKQDIYTILSTVLGIGFIPFMPGTFGTLAAALLYLTMPAAWFVSFPYAGFLIAAIIILFFIGVFLTNKAEAKLGHDAGSIVLDEFVAYFVCVMFLPWSYLMAIYAFALFRVFDIAKPQPIRMTQKLKGGWGIMTDDIVAALFTNAFMQILIRLYPKFF